MYSLLWSEHCAYKHSKKLLRTLPTEGAHVVMGPGENAGAVDVGGGLVCAFKVESHNHPSAVEPFQGAATGRRRDPARHLRDRRAADRGARLAALRRAVRRARALPARRRRVRDRALRQLDRRADRRRRGLLRGALRAELPGQRDGARPGAARAARAQRGRRPRQRARAVRRLHRPRRHRRRLGARLGRAGRRATATARTSARPCRWATRSRRRSCSSARWSCCERGLLVSLQDLGAAGLTSSASEMASKGEVGIDIDVARVPLREPGMEPFEMMVERVPGADAVRGRARQPRGRAGPAARSGRSAARRSARSPTAAGCACSPTARLVGDMPVRALVDDCPLYDLRPNEAPGAAIPGAGRHARRRCQPAARRCWRCSRAPTSPRARPLFEQYDAIVQSRTVRRPEQADAAVLALPDGSALAVSIDGNGRRVAADPYRGTVAAVLECAVEPRLRRRRAARNDQQPQLRQPREAAHRLAADRIGPRPGRRLPRAGGADRGRQRLALQRGRRPGRSTRRR